MRRAPRLYRLLLALYPADFRRSFGPEMEDTFEAHRRAAPGAAARAGVWVAGIRDLLTGAARERIGRLRREPGRDDGAVGSVERAHRRGGGAMGGWAMDLRVAARGLMRRPALAGTAILTLAVGIGGTTAIFSVVNGLLFRPFGYADEDRLVQVWSAAPERGWTDLDVTLPEAWAWRDRGDAFDDLAAFTYVGITDGTGEVPERLDGVWGTPNLLSVLGVEPAFGRGFSPDDGREGAPDVVILSHGYWVRALGADPGVIGRDLDLNGSPRTVVGVMAEGFRFLAMPVDVVVPWQGDPDQESRLEHSWQAVGRLAPGATVATARTAVREASADLARRYPDTNEGFTADVLTLRQELMGDTAGRAALVLLGAVGFVLLMACVNVANLLLSRSGERRGEMAVRSALGASRGRLVRQLMAEAFLLSLVGGAAGSVLAVWGRRMIVGGLPSYTPPVFTFDLDVRVLVFSTGLVVLAALLFGLVPAFRTATPASGLRESGRGGTPRARAAGALVVVQTALAVVLLVGGVIMTRGVVALRTQDTGWSSRGVLTARLSPRTADYPGDAEVEAFHGRVETAIRALPGVVAVGATRSMPLQGSNQIGALEVLGREAGAEELSVRVTRLTPGYLEALDLEVLSGRDVSPADRADAESVALVNETFVRRYLEGGPALDRSFRWNPEDAPVRIVGVVEDHIERAVDRPVEPAVYLPMAQGPAWTRTLVIRTDGDPGALAGAVRAAVAGVDPTVPVFEVRTMDDRVAERLSGFDLLAELMGAFALISLLLGAVGIYGVTARAVAGRRREIGLRLALGADPASVQRSIASHALRRVILGLAFGLLLAVPLSGALQGVVAGVDARDPASFLPAMLVLLLVGGAGAWIPARGASRIDPVRTLAAD